MRRLSPLFAVLFVVAILGSDSPRDYNDAVVVDELTGEWSPDGKPIKNFGVLDKTLTWALPKQFVISSSSCGIFKVSCLEDVLSGWNTTTRVDARYNPAHMDVTKTENGKVLQTWKCIYRIDGDTLQIGSMRNESVRPNSFDEKGIRYRTYKRVK